MRHRGRIDVNCFSNRRRGHGNKSNNRKSNNNLVYELVFQAVKIKPQLIVEALLFEQFKGQIVYRGAFE